MNATHVLPGDIRDANIVTRKITHTFKAPGPGSKLIKNGDSITQKIRKITEPEKPEMPSLCLTGSAQVSSWYVRREAALRKTSPPIMAEIIPVISPMIHGFSSIDDSERLSFDFTLGSSLIGIEV